LDLHAQFSFIEEPYSQLEVSFLKEKEEIDPNISFFNVLKIVNPTDRRLRFDVNFSIPANWTIMGERTIPVILSPGETRLIPIRAAADVNTQGDIGYSIVASLKDYNNKVIKNIYSYVNVPRKSNIKFKAMDRVVYFDPIIKKTTASFVVSNHGNVNELIYINLNLAPTLEMIGATNNIYKTDFILQARRDTIVSYEIILKDNKDIVEIKDHRIIIEAGSKDYTFNATIWSRSLKSQYEFAVPMSDRVLVAELGLLNLFGQYNPVFEGAFWGSLKTQSIYTDYFFRTQGQQFYETDPWLYSQFYINVNYKNFNLNIGDVSFPLMLNLYGRGLSLKLIHKDMNLNTLYSKNILNETKNFGFLYNHTFSRLFQYSIGMGFKEKSQSLKEILPEIGTKIKISNHYVFSLKGGYSFSENFLTDEANSGFGSSLSFNVRYPKLTWNNRINYATPTFSGRLRGRNEIYSNFLFPFTRTESFQGSYSSQIKEENIEIMDTITNPLKNSQHQFRILYNNLLSNQLSFGVGPWVNYKGSNSFYGYNPEHWFSTISPMLNVQLRYRSVTNLMNFTGEIRGGVNYVLDYSSEYFGVPIVNIEKRERLSPGFYLNIAARTRQWSLSGTYFHGPSSITQHYSKFYNSVNSKSIRLIPSLNILFFEKFFEYNLRGNYIYDITAQMNRISMGNELIARPGKGWMVTLSNTIGYQSTTEKRTEEKYKYSNMYFEFRIRKEFGFNQPKFKYLNLNVSFYKDLNGNGQRDEDEPGVENVLVSVDKDYEMSDSLLGREQLGEFYAMEFLSDLNGIVTYRNIVSGFYNIKFSPMGKTSGNFVTDRSNLKFHIDKSQTIDIPFQEKNKIFGQILMNRSKLSNLGTIDISNIKVTATDTKGKMFSTLTDKNGKFVIYVPNVEKYNVSINNIFREHFELEQNSFEVQLNGYKQFELTYIFTEKQRRINFAQQVSFDAQSQQVQVVKRTNLGGTVKDGTTFAPIKSLVKIIDVSTGNVVSETVSDGRTGTFYISFVSGQNYRLDVTANDYWFYSEQLVGDQLSTFMNLNRDLTLTAITVGSKLTLRNVTFERNQSELNAEARVELSRLLEVLNANPGIQIQLVGHCDDVEAIDRVDIAEDRAKAVMKYLVENGYTNVTHSTSGGLDPVANEASEEARKMNRRVEAIVISK
jgi:outer membrane protein OmpA-like peptidoglycan-associated protein